MSRRLDININVSVNRKLVTGIMLTTTLNYVMES